MLKFVIDTGLRSPTDPLVFSLVVEVDGQVIYNITAPVGLHDPLVGRLPVTREGSYDSSAALHIEYKGVRDNRYVHFACEPA